MEHFWQGVGVPKGSVQLWARKVAPASAPTVILGCERAGNSSLQVEPTLTLSRRTSAMDQVIPQDLACSFLPGKGMEGAPLQLLGKSWKGQETRVIFQ